MEYFVAKSYENWKRIGEPFTKNGKLYTKAQTKCGRCVDGVYVSRIENGRPVPHPMYGGVCLRCGGSGIEAKEIRLYTKEEKAAATRSQERSAALKVEKKLAEAGKKRTDWLLKNGFSADGVTSIYVGEDSFIKKDILKAAGFSYHPSLGWHIGQASFTADGIDTSNIVELQVDQLASFNLYGEGYWLSTASSVVNTIKEARRPQSNSQFLGEIGETLRDIPVVVSRISSCVTQFGYSNIVTFKNNENILTWFTTANLKFAEGDEVLLSAKVKDHKTYKNVPQTIVSYAKFK